MISERSKRKRRGIAGEQVELFLSILATKRDVQVRGKAHIDGVDKVCIDNRFGLLLPTGNEISRRVRAE